MKIKAWWSKTYGMQQKLHSPEGTLSNKMFSYKTRKISSKLILHLEELEKEEQIKSKLAEGKKS